MYSSEYRTMWLQPSAIVLMMVLQTCVAGRFERLERRLELKLKSFQASVEVRLDATEGYFDTLADRVSKLESIVNKSDTDIGLTRSNGSRNEPSIEYTKPELNEIQNTLAMYKTSFIKQKKEMNDVKFDIFTFFGNLSSDVKTKLALHVVGQIEDNNKTLMALNTQVRDHIANETESLEVFKTSILQDVNETRARVQNETTELEKKVEKLIGKANEVVGIIDEQRSTIEDGIMVTIRALYSSWSGWSTWSDCPQSCQSGNRSRHRSCDVHPPVTDGICIGNDTDTEECIIHEFCTRVLNCTIPKSTDVHFSTLSGVELKEGTQIQHGQEFIAEKECKDYYVGYYLNYEDAYEEVTSSPTRLVNTHVNCTDGVLSDYTLVCDDVDNNDTAVTNPEGCMTVQNGIVTDNGQSVKCNEGYVNAQSLLYERYSCSCDRNIPALVCNGKQAKCNPALCPDGCQNGGTCTSPIKCSCPEGFSGNRCQTEEGCQAPIDKGNNAIYRNGATFTVTHDSCTDGNVPSFKGQITCENGRWSEQIRCLRAPSFRIRVKTADYRTHNGAQQNVHLKIYGSKDTADWTKLNQTFERGRITDEWLITRNIGKIKRIVLSTGKSNLWKPDYVTIHDEDTDDLYVFRYNRREYIHDRTITLYPEDSIAASLTRPATEQFGEGSGNQPGRISGSVMKEEGVKYIQAK
ncbi:uncharacterized protein LOC128240247 isoform X2 [Mya arenaria]|uniref:uncharacterized protein LOC128240247 isoform X2 n=1 Tax=Mya arenaria TaxID=6604 RepID=UPI0022E129A3|nr:uncharacterized protein LOC128240247 isoform X2 [Mya arenaria]